MPSSSESTLKLYWKQEKIEKTKQLIIIFYWKKKQYSWLPKAIHDKLYKDRGLHSFYVCTHSWHYITSLQAPSMATVLGNE